MSEPMVRIEDFVAATEDLCADCQRAIRKMLISRLAVRADPPITGLNKDLLDLAASIAEDHRVTMEGLRARSNTAELVAARRDFAKQARERGYSLPAIGRTIAKHHTTIINLVKGRGYK